MPEEPIDQPDASLNTDKPISSKRRATTFKPGDDAPRIAAAKSALARTPIDLAEDAKHSYKAVKRLMEVIEERIFNPTPCKSCKRSGPVSLKDLIELMKLFSTFAEMVQVRGWGKPATASPYGREASIDEFKRARAVVERANRAGEPEAGQEPSEETTGGDTQYSMPESFPPV